MGPGEEMLSVERLRHACLPAGHCCHCRHMQSLWKGATPRIFAQLITAAAGTAMGSRGEKGGKGERGAQTNR